ncbi:hypothetical protein ACJQW4_06455 [Acinetobacter sp. A7.4]|uniref:hypothetical protein n=2 Tax=Acinetobacter sp. A7.4 TaxID=2919921 RepID=UPI0039A52418
MMTTLRKYWNNTQRYIWLVGGVVCLFIALIFWAGSDSSEELVEVNKVVESDAELQIQPARITATTNLGTLQEEVRPIALTTRVLATGNHANEFRGSKFIAEQKNKTAIELFHVTEEDIIKSYLNKQTNRQNYFYLRLSGEQQQEQYVLFYGLYSGENEAKQALAQLDLKLPASVQPQVQALEDYASQVNDMGVEEMLGSTQLYAVKLSPAALPKLDVTMLNANKPNKPASTNSNHADTANATTSTTVTRRDAEGNVIDVHKSQSHTENNSKSTSSTSNSSTPVRQEIADPFN